MELEKFLNSGTGLITAIAAFIAAIAALVTAIGKYQENLFKKANRNISKPSKIKILIKQTIFILGMSSLFVSIGIFTVRAFKDSTHIEITYPTDGNKVFINETIQGKSKNIPNDKMIWIVVYSYPSEKYFPSHKPALIDNNGNWSSSVIIGSSADSGKRFSISAYLIDESIRNELEREFNRLDFAGFEKLPSTIQLFDRIFVFRR